ncbi:sulfatase-like hydrolase/transferase [Haloarcula japonica]|uniref:sulfatase-like hydrolase/transferase n=1 Tax=Haloarcula japonica TaxID=29282 RepID=UPI0039F6FF9E
MSSGTALPEINEVSNIYIFVSDALRWDSIPESVQSLGATFKTVASGCATMRSVSSILTGINPPRHGVSSWTDQLNEPTILQTADLNSGFYNPAGGKKGGLNVILDRNSEEELGKIKPPFVYFERDQGGHAPYRGLSYDEMLSDLNHTRESLKQYYSEMVDKSIARFEDRLETLDDRDLLSETLIVFLSDHGELLGEHGLVSHSSPPVPELVYVPTVFIHPEIDERQHRQTIGHIDLAPTVLSALDTNFPKQSFDGVDLFQKTPGLRYNDSKYDIKIKSRKINIYQSSGLWDENGGHVFTSRGKLISPLIGWKRAQGWNRAYWRENPSDILRGLRCLSTPHKRYGSPEFSKVTAKEGIADVQSSEGTAETVELEDDVEERLEDLGYR